MRKRIDYCVEHQIGNLVIGYNKDFQRSSNMGRISNQKFVQIPLCNKLKYQCEVHGITYIKQEKDTHPEHLSGIRMKSRYRRKYKKKIYFPSVESRYTVECIKLLNGRRIPSPKPPASTGGGHLQERPITNSKDY